MNKLTKNLMVAISISYFIKIGAAILSSKGDKQTDKVVLIIISVYVDYLLDAG